MLTDRGLRHSKLSAARDSHGRAMVEKDKKASTKKATKRKAAASSTIADQNTCKQSSAEQNNNVKRPHLSTDGRDDMFAAYQPWVIQTYGDLAKTKTITLRKYARILRTLRGDEIISADNSKFRFWVKAKGFHIGQPAGYDPKPADSIVGRYSVCDIDESIPPVSAKQHGTAKDPSLYVPNAPFKQTNGQAVHRKVAIVENFFDIIYSVHVELEGRPGKHAGQKRTYRTITETYAFLPREAVTRFLLGCTECQKHPRTPSPIAIYTPCSPSPTLPPTTLPSPTPAAARPLMPMILHSARRLNATTQTPKHVEVAYVRHKVDAASVPNEESSTQTELDLSLRATKTPMPPQAAATPDAVVGLEQNGDIAQSRSRIAPPLTRHQGTQSIGDSDDFSSETASKIATESKESKQPEEAKEGRRSSNPLDVCNLLTEPPPPPKTPPKKRLLNYLSDEKNDKKTLKLSKSSKVIDEEVSNSSPKSTNTCKAKVHASPKLWSPVESIERDQTEKSKRVDFAAGEFDYNMPITSTYLKYMRSLGCPDEDALQFEKQHENLSTPESSETNEEDHFGGTGIMKDSDKFKLMLLAWNYHNQAQGANRNGAGGGGGGGEVPDLSSLAGNEEMAGLWAQYHALGLAKGGKATPPAPRDQSSPVNAETGSAHDETSSSGNKEDEDDDDDESDDKIDTQTHDPERLKAFNMFVRLFVDENLDRMVPISKQPKEKIQAIIDSCTRQFPEFAERARKRIRTYLKSCRRNKRARDPNSPWDATRPTPAHLTSVQAEQILATACENESHNAKRMRLGLEPVSQPMPLPPGSSATDTTAPMNRGLDFSASTPGKLDPDGIANVFPSSTTPSSTPNSISKGLPLTPDIKPNPLSVSSALGSTPMNGIGIASTAGSAAPTAMYRPNFSQAFQRTGPYPLFPGQTPFPSNSSSGLLTNGPADLSMKQKPLLNHKLSTGEMTAVRQLITGYRESAAFLLRSADELEQLLIQQQ